MLWSQLNSVLAKKNQMQPEELLLQVPRDATHKVPEEGPFASPMMVTLPPVKETAQIKSEADVLVTTIPLLTEKDQMQPEELHPQFSREATHECTSHQFLLKSCHQYSPSVAVSSVHPDLHIVNVGMSLDLASRSNCARLVWTTSLRS
ncbi:hypothetical protein AOLI_G00208050 [Acnodon oligacanthus]